MHPNSKISIITPSFNQGEFLAETIESVISQAGDFLLDYIIVDGGSIDNSVTIIRHYESQLLQGTWPVACNGITFRWTSEKDSGQSDALMKGFSRANGDIIAWLNSDDTYQPGALETVISFFNSNRQAGLLYGDARYCDKSGTIIGRYNTEEFNFDRLAWFNFICQPSAFFSKEAFNAVGGLDESLHFAMDFDLWVRIGTRFPCHYLPRFFSTYRLHDSSKTISTTCLYENCEEALHLTIKYFGWAPLTRVYNSCNAYCRAQLPTSLTKFQSIVITATIFCTVLRSLRLNRGFCKQDLKLIHRANFRKLFKSRIEIMTGSKGERGEP